MGNRILQGNLIAEVTKECNMYSDLRTFAEFKTSEIPKTDEVCWAVVASSISRAFKNWIG